jgi:hypothetical protein
MPYPSPQQRRIPTTRETVGAEFVRPNGKVETQVDHSKTIGSTVDADIDTQVVFRKVPYSCGCFWPEVDPGGVCAECAEGDASPNVCKVHFVVCECGTPCCWKHSHPTAERTARRCSRCHLRQKNEEMKTAVVGFLSRLARAVFFK